MNRKLAPISHLPEHFDSGLPLIAEPYMDINSKDEIFKLDIIVPSKGYGLYTNKFTALYASSLLFSGTARKTSEQIAEEIDVNGTYIFKNCDYYNFGLTIYGQRDKFPAILERIRSYIEECIFPETELDIFKSRKLSELEINLQKTSFRAGRAINSMVLGDAHPYSQRSDRELIESVNSQDLSKYRDELLSEVILIYTGNNSSEIKGICEAFGFKTMEKLPETIVDAKTDSSSISEDFIHIESSTQNSIRMGKIIPGRRHEDHFKIALFNLIYGGYFGSRLMKNIREDKGLTYGIHSSVTGFRDYSYFRINSDCNSELSDLVLEETLKELKTLQTELVAEDELETARNYYTGALLRNFDGPFNLSDRLKSSLELGTYQPGTYYAESFSKIQNVSASDILEVANNYFDIQTLKHCIAGKKGA